jgi:hypothetical protein
LFTIRKVAQLFMCGTNDEYRRAKSSQSIEAWFNRLVSIF